MALSPGPEFAGGMVHPKRMPIVDNASGGVQGQCAAGARQMTIGRETPPAGVSSA